MCVENEITAQSMYDEAYIKEQIMQVFVSNDAINGPECHNTS